MSRSPSPSVARARGAVAAFSRSRLPDDPDFLCAKRDLAAENIAAYVARTVAAAPPLTRDQQSRIVALLGGGL
jgi:hypothetical protein